MTKPKRPLPPEHLTNESPSLGRVLSLPPADNYPAAPDQIVLRLEGGHIVAQCGRSFAVYELVWESRHGDQRRRLTLRQLAGIPRQFEAEAIRVMHPTG